MSENNVIESHHFAARIAKKKFNHQDNQETPDSAGLLIISVPGTIVCKVPSNHDSDVVAILFYQ